MRKWMRLWIAGTIVPLGLPLAHAAQGSGADLQSLEDEIRAQKVKLEALEDKLSGMQEGQATEEASAEKAETPKLDVGGALRFNYVLTDFDDQGKDRGGDLVFDIFRIDVNGSYKDVLLSAQYRWYRYMDVLHHGWVGYKFSDATQVQAGLTKVPFGILPYASHNWWFGETYYVGLEDDYDMGVKVLYRDDPWDLRVGFFKNADWGSPTDPSRYSVDVVVEGDQQNEETNQGNVRLAYTFKRPGLGSTELGVSGMWGQLYNRTTEDAGDHWAAALHLNGFYGSWNVMLEAARYLYDPKNPDGVSDRTVLLGAYGGTFPVAARGNLYVANLAYTWPVAWGPISDLQFYNDYSILVKDESSFPDTQIDTVGCLIHAGPVYTYVDLIFGKNALYLGAGDAAQAGSDQDRDWNVRFNVNVGYYF